MCNLHIQHEVMNVHISAVCVSKVSNLHLLSNSIKKNIFSPRKTQIFSKKHNSKRNYIEQQERKKRKTSLLAGVQKHLRAHKVRVKAFKSIFCRKKKYFLPAKWTTKLLQNIDACLYWLISCWSAGITGCHNPIVTQQFYRMYILKTCGGGVSIVCSPNPYHTNNLLIILAIHTDNCIYSMPYFTCFCFPTMAYNNNKSLTQIKLLLQ